MRSPDAPDNMPDPGVSAHVGFVAGGPTGPELDQAARAHARAVATFTEAPVVQGRPAGDSGDHRSPQQFANHPRLIDAINTTAVGDDTAGQSLPGRLRPSEWDGEPGFLAAIGAGDI